MARRFGAPSVAISSGVKTLFSSAWFHILRRFTDGASAFLAYMRAYGWASGARELDGELQEESSEDECVRRRGACAPVAALLGEELGPAAGCWGALPKR